ncbi:MAG: hypothetical protein OXC46_01135 [Thaumarchaeota archaeon]|nr:hypothetical protein [Nitrososphaerota archaeon]
MNEQKISEFIVSIIPNEVKMTTYCYTPKHILKMLKNAKYLKFVIKDGHIKIKESN